MNDIEKILHLNDVKVDSIEGVLKDTINTSAIDVAGNAPGVSNTDKLSQVKSHIGDLKCAWVLSEAALWFVNGLEKENLADIEENWLSCEDHVQIQEKELMNKERKEAEIMKNDIEEIEEELEKHAERIQTADEDIREHKQQIKDIIYDVKDKMEKLEKLKERKQLLETQKRLHASGGATVSYQDNLAEKMNQTTGALKQCSAAVDSLTEHTSLLETERDSCQKTLMKLEETLSISTKEQVTLVSSQEQERMDFLHDFVASCGLRVVNIAENWIEIELSDIYSDSSCEDVSSMLLTVHFGESNSHDVIIEDVTADCSTSFINDLIDKLKSTHELKVFNIEVQERFHNHVKLLKEMKVLQKRFAIDWNEVEQVVRLMLGKSGQIVCTLKIQNGYPTDGEVSVVDVHGADRAIIFQDSVVTKELRTLTSWIEYLDIKYSSL